MASLALYDLGIGNTDFPQPNRSRIQSVSITILYDNNPYDHRLKTGWGFSCLIEFDGMTMLFDTGGDGQTLFENMRILNKSPKTIEVVVLSHIHGDHTGGLLSLLRENANLKIYIPASFPQEFEQTAKGYGAKVVRVNSPLEIFRGVYSTGEMGHGIKEQSLLINTHQGVILITGCAHPGIIHIIKKAKTMTGRDINLVLGGFHLSSLSERELKEIIDAFLRMEIQKVAPCHCTGDLAISAFGSTFGKNFIKAGVGRVIEVQ